MTALALIVLPVFGLIAIGYLARLCGLLSDKTGDGLSDFVFSLGVPCLIFTTLARATIPPVQPWGYWVAYFAGAGFVWLVATLIARGPFAATPREGIVAGFAAGQSNTVFVGVPMILQAYGDAGAVPLSLLLAIHLPVMMTIATLLAEGRSASPLLIAKRLLTHPIIVGVLLGSAVRLLPGGMLPTPAWQILDLIASATVPCALIAMGVALRRYGFAAGWQLPAIVSALKLIVHPLIVFLLATRVFSMPPAWAGVAVLFAACPSGINAYLFADRYKEGVSLASSTLALSTALAVATSIFWLWMLGIG